MGANSMIAGRFIWSELLVIALTLGVMQGKVL